MEVIDEDSKHKQHTLWVDYENKTIFNGLQNISERLTVAVFESRDELVRFLYEKCCSGYKIG